MSKTLYVGLPLGHDLVVFEGKGNDDHLFSVESGVVTWEGDVLYGRTYYYDNPECFEAFMDGMLALSHFLGLYDEVVDTNDEEDEKKEGEEC